MALKPCRECKKEVSPSAKSCPHCGAPTPTRSRKPISAGMGCLILLGLGALVSLITPGDSPGPATVAVQLECIPVGSHLTADLGASEAMAVQVAVPQAPGLASRGRVYFVATANGAMWVSSISPTVDQSGIVLPLNAAARSQSQLGAEVRPDAPIYAGMSEAHDAARAARACALN